MNCGTSRTISTAKKIDPNARWIDQDTVGPFTSESDASTFATTIGYGTVVANGHGWNVSFHRGSTPRQSLSEKEAIRQSAASDLLAGMPVTDVARKYKRTYVWAFKIGQSVRSKTVQPDTIYAVLSLLVKTTYKLHTIANRLNLPIETVQTVYDNAIQHGIPMKERS